MVRQLLMPKCIPPSPFCPKAKPKSKIVNFSFENFVVPNYFFKLGLNTLDVHTKSVEV